MSEIVLSSRNAKKVAELQAILGDFGVRVRPVSDFPGMGDIEETGATFHDNAALKAETVGDVTGLPTIADDSGLIVDAIAPLPGVHSARFAELYGATRTVGSTDPVVRNNALLQWLLRDVPLERRTARFVCVIAVAIPGEPTRFFEGTCRGRILDEPRGGTGFGYDPYFLSDDLGRTFAEVPGPEKHAVSHRGRALAAMIDGMRAWFDVHRANVARRCAGI